MNGMTWVYGAMLLTATLSVVLTTAAAGAEREVALTVEEPAGVARMGEPVTSGLPFPRGRLKDPRDLRLFDSSGKPVPCQAVPMARWPDGSLKWVLLDFQANVPANGRVDYRLRWDDSGASAPPSPSVTVREMAEGIRVDTGALRFRVGRKSDRFFQDAMLSDGKGREVQVSAGGLCADLEMPDGVRCPGQIGDAPDDLRVELAGPLHAVIRCSGWHVAKDGRRPMQFVARIHAYAGLPTLRVLYTFIQGADERIQRIRDVVLRLNLPPSADEYALGLDSPAREVTGRLRTGQFVRLLQVGPTAFEKEKTPFICTLRRYHESGEKLVQEGYAGRAPGWADLRAPAGLGATLALRYFWQLHPKSIVLRPGEIAVGLWSQPAGNVAAEARWNEKGYFAFGPWSDADGTVPVEMGLAKTHELLIDFTCGPRESGRIAQVRAALEAPLMAQASPAWYRDSRALGTFAIANPARYPRFEHLVELAGLHYLPGFRETHSQYGLRDFGDLFHDRNSAWNNNEYDATNSWLLAWVRSGDRRYFDLADTIARHQMDIDVAHRHPDPAKNGAVHVHKINHTGVQPDEPDLGKSAWHLHFGHMWNRGLFNYYLLTGDGRAREVAVAIAGYIHREFDGREFKSADRNIGWPLQALVAAYDATVEEKYIRLADQMVNRLIAIRPASGHWTDKPLHESVVVQGLRHYVEARGMKDELKPLILGIADWMMQTWNPEAKAFPYIWQEKPRERPQLSAMSPLGALGWAYQLTGQRRYLDVCLQTFDNWLSLGETPYQFPKGHVEKRYTVSGVDATGRIHYGFPGEHCANSCQLRYLLPFLALLDAEGERAWRDDRPAP